MSTKKNHFILLLVKVKWLTIPMAVPLYVADELIEGISDFFALFRHIQALHWFDLAIALTRDGLRIIRRYGPIDLADIRVKSEKGFVKIMMLLR